MTNNHIENLRAVVEAGEKIGQEVNYTCNLQGHSSLINFCTLAANARDDLKQLLDEHEKLKAENERMRQALEFYAENETRVMGYEIHYLHEERCVIDRGEIAKQALEGREEG